MKKFLILAAFLVASATSVAQAAVIIGDFEGSDPGTWGYWSGGVQTPLGDHASLEYSTEDATVGSTSVKATNSGYVQNLAYAADFATREAFLANDQLSFDVVYPETTESGWWEVFELVMNSNAGFNGLTANLTNSDGGTNQIGWAGGGGGRRVVTYTLDYSSEVTAWAGATPSYLELIFSLNNDGVHTDAYIDNVQLTSAAVPEPTSLLLFGLASLALPCAARRRVR